MKIKKIDINNFGSYKQYRWINNETEFKDINIIYGRNYSGKTTLSRIFKCIENKNIHQDYENPDFCFILEDNSIINTTNIETNNIKVYVYNTDFVNENLNWLHNQDGTIEPFTVLGETNIEIEEKISNIVDKLGDRVEEDIEEPNKGLFFELFEFENDFEQSKKEYDNLSTTLNKKLRDKANKEIKHNTLYKNPNYRINNIEDDIKEVKRHNFKIMTNEEVDKYKKLVEENIKENDVDKLPNKKPNFENLYNEVKEIVTKEIKPSVPIQDLLNDSILQEWVRQGASLHKNKKDICSFCGSIIDDNLWKKLDEHFSKESEELRVEIQKKIQDLKVKRNALDDFIKFNENSFYSSFQNEIKTSLELWKNLQIKYQKNIDLLIGSLEKRLKDIFNSLQMEKIEDVSDDMVKLFNEFNIWINRNNEKTTSLYKEQKEARELLRLNEVAKFIKDIDYDSKIKSISDEKDKKELLKEKFDKKINEIKELEEKIRVLQTELEDESRGAELVNEYLEKYFGNNGFKLSSNDDGEGVKYKISRDGVDAKNLSEGECSLISFCYFMAKIKDKLEDTVNHNEIIIYIDDPISSLDSNHIFFIFSLIEHKITQQKNYKQLFISTHNLDFLKYIKRLTLPGKAKNTLRHFLIEMNQKENEKRSFIKVMPNHLKNYVTEFNYLFNELYEVYTKDNLENFSTADYNQFYNIPNNIRKFLEYYLFYKYPNKESPLSNLDKLFGGEIPSKINRVVNELSHLTFIDRGWSPMDVPEIEECVKIVIDTIKEKDEEQFNALVESIN